MNSARTKALRLLFLTITVSFLAAPFFFTFYPFKLSDNYARQRRFRKNIPSMYSRYSFTRSPEVINLGIQPLYNPTGIIIEAIRRDQILTESMQKSGFDLEFFSFLNGVDVNRFIKSGELQGGIGGETSAISLASVKDIIVPAIIQSGFTSIVARRDIFINEIQGRRIGYVPGTISHFALRKALLSEGLDEDDVGLVAMNVTEIPEALESGVIDAFSAWEPTPGVLLKIYSDLETIYKRLNSGFFYFSEEFYLKHPEAVKNILAAELRAVRWIKSDKKNLFRASEWAILAGDKMTEVLSELSPSQAVELASKDLFMTSSVPVVPGMDKSELRRLKESFLFLKSIGEIPADALWAKVSRSFSGNILYYILSNPGKYRINEFNYRKTENPENS